MTDEPANHEPDHGMKPSPERQRTILVQGCMEDDIDEDAIRLTAYFLWDQEGRSDRNPEDYWQRALELHRRAKAFDRELSVGPQRESEDDQ